MPFNQPGNYLAVARFTRESADAVMNTFYFDTDLGSGAVDDVVNRLEDFYFLGAPVTGATINTYLSPAITGLSYYVRRADAPLGEPGEEIPSTLWSRQAASRGQMPPDAAICSSYRAEPPYTKRRRGRIYLGPLGGIALDTATGRVASDCRAAILAKSAQLASISQTNPVRWVIASRVGNVAAVIREGYVDPHFDTQRGRDPHAEFFGRHPAEWTSGT